jgi:L,D-transpeptidase YcbB
MPPLFAVTHSRGPAGLRFVLSLMFVAGLRVGVAPPTAQARQTQSHANSSHNLHDPPAALQAIIRSGRLDDLRWPDFFDVQPQAEVFYRASAYKLAWIEGDKPTRRASEMIDILKQADGEGLRPEDYDGPRWRDRLTLLDGPHAAADEAKFDAALTICTMRYASAVRIGRINPKHLQFDIDIEHKRLNLPEFVRLLLSEQTDLKSEFAAIEPPFDRYKSTRTALLKYMQLEQQDDGEKLPVPGEKLLDAIFPFTRYDGVPRMTRLLRLVGDLPDDAVLPTDPRSYEGPLVDAVKRFQKRHGLRPNGYLTRETVQEMNVPLGARVEQLRLALERYRWLRYNFTQPPVFVNLPEFRLYALAQNGQIGLTMNVNVGDAYDFQTPVFENYIRFVVFRPYWNVPPKILRDEVIPEIAENPSYIEENDMEVTTLAGDVVARGKISDSVLQQLRAGKLTVRQRPGPDNSLGLLKVMFPNPYHVYLHDTAQGYHMFSGTQRALSHGCIHLQEPAKLAAWLLRDKPDWTLERVEQAMQHGRDNFTVNLTQPVPILLFYLTVVPEEDGQVNFYRDIYGHDAALQSALAKGQPYRVPQKPSPQPKPSTNR